MKPILTNLGFGKIYFSIIPWKNDETLRARYEMCKIWEMLFESMPSVALSTYAILANDTNNDTANTSVFISMLFSFINITNTVVCLSDNDKIQHGGSIAINNIHNNTRCENYNQNRNQNDVNNPRDKIGNGDSTTAIDAMIILDETENKHIHEIELVLDNGDTNDEDGHVHPKYWIFDASTNDIKFFKEEKCVKTNSKTKKQKSKSRGKTLFSCLFKFDVNKKVNFIIWIFLTTDLFVKTFSMLFVIAFVNNNNINTNTSNNIIGGIFVCCLGVLEYCCFNHLVTNDNNSHLNNFGFSLKYFLVCTFTISFYFLIFVGLPYLPKAIERNKFIKYQSFKIVLSTLLVLLVWLLQSFLLLDTQIVSMKFFVVFLIVLLIHTTSFFYLNKMINV